MTRRGGAISSSIPPCIEISLSTNAPLLSRCGRMCGSPDAPGPSSTRETGRGSVDITLPPNYVERRTHKYATEVGSSLAERSVHSHDQASRKGRAVRAAGLVGPRRRRGRQLPHGARCSLFIVHLPAASTSNLHLTKSGVDLPVNLCGPPRDSRHNPGRSRRVGFYLTFNLWQIKAEAKSSRGPIVAAWRAGTFAVVGEFDDFEESEVR